MKQGKNYKEIKKGDYKEAEARGLLYLQEVANLWGVTYAKLAYAMKTNRVNFNFILGGNNFKKVLFDDIKSINPSEIFC